MTKVKRFLITTMVVIIMVVLPRSNVKAASPEEVIAPLGESPSKNYQYAENYVKNIEFAFSDGTESNSIDVQNYVWRKLANTEDKDNNQKAVQIQYRVQEGDCLWKISKAFSIPIDKLLELNSNINNPNLIYVGDAIVLLILE